MGVGSGAAGHGVQFTRDHTALALADRSCAGAMAAGAAHSRGGDERVARCDEALGQGDFHGDLQCERGLNNANGPGAACNPGRGSRRRHVCRSAWRCGGLRQAGHAHGCGAAASGGACGFGRVVDERLIAGCLAQMIKKNLACARGLSQKDDRREPPICGVGAAHCATRDARCASADQRLRLSGAMAARVRVHSSRPSSAGGAAGARLLAADPLGAGAGRSTSPSRSSRRVRARCGWRR